MQATLIDQGISLMLYGMGTVFVFLCILVFAILLMSNLVNRFASSESSQSTPELAASHPRPQILRAIEKAIDQHRNRS